MDRISMNHKEKIIGMKSNGLLFVLAIIFLFASCAGEQGENYGFDEEDGYLAQLNRHLFGLEPLIADFGGELFGDPNVTADGRYTGFERLDSLGWANTMIYCGDDGAVMWVDYEKEAVYRLNARDQKEKICPVEECRSDAGSFCGHMPMYDLVYSDGFLYFAIGFFYDENAVFAFKYDIDVYEYEKLAEFWGVSYCSLALFGRYLYVETYNDKPHASGVIRPDNRVDFTIARIDLFTQSAAVVYSDLKNPGDFGKIGELRDWRFVGNRIIMPKIDEDKILDKETKEWIILKTGSSVNATTIDMRNFKTLAEMEGENIMFAFGGGAQLYGGEIYLSTAEAGLCRIDEKTGKREILHKEIFGFCIDGDFLYYFLGDALYRLKLDYTRELVFNDAVMVYAPNDNQRLEGWKACGGYIYACLTGGSGGRYCRIKPNSTMEPYFLP